MIKKRLSSSELLDQADAILNDYNKTKEIKDIKKLPRSLLELCRKRATKSNRSGSVVGFYGAENDLTVEIDRRVKRNSAVIGFVLALVIVAFGVLLTKLLT